MRILTALAVFALAFPVAAAEQIDCSDASNTFQMNFCADKEFAAADAELNAVYKKALAKIAQSSGEKPYDRKSWEAALRASQRAWVAFRDADCKGLVPMEWSGGSGTTVAVLGCMIQLTQTRAKTLKEGFTEPDGPAKVP